MPAATANPMRMKTRNLLFPENSMMRLIMFLLSGRRHIHPRHRSARRRLRWRGAFSGTARRAVLVSRHPRGRGFQLAFRVDQEVAGDDDGFSRRQPFGDLDAIADPFPD